MRGPGILVRLILAWHGLGLAIRRAVFIEVVMPSEVVAVSDKVLEVPVTPDVLRARVRDKDLSAVERHEAAVDLIEQCHLRTLAAVIEDVYGKREDITYEVPSPGAFDAMTDAIRSATMTR